MANEISDLVNPSAWAFSRYVGQAHPYEVQLLLLAQINKELVKRIIESGFDERLVSNYFDGKDDAQFFLDRENKGVAVLMRDYLDILAVANEHRRNGIGPALLKRVIEETNGRFYLRSQPHRSVNSTYQKFAKSVPFKSADGIQYNGYLSGYTPSEISERLELMVQKPSNFVQ